MTTFTVNWDPYYLTNHPNIGWYDSYAWSDIGGGTPGRQDDVVLSEAFIPGSLVPFRYDLSVGWTTTVRSMQIYGESLSIGNGYTLSVSDGVTLQNGGEIGMGGGDLSAQSLANNGNSEPPRVFRRLFGLSHAAMAD
jgi:hypothetical protein